MSLSPGAVLPKDMNQREWAIWNRAQNLDTVIGSAISDAIAALNLVSGTYTPTLTPVANVVALTAYVCQYLRSGSVVTVSGKFDVDQNAAPAATQVGISLPVASNFTAAENCGGTACAPGNIIAAIYGDAANNRAEAAWSSIDTSTQTVAFSFTFRVI